MRRLFLFLLLLPTFAFADDLENQILFLMKRGNVEQAIHLYREQYEKQGSHDFELLQDLGVLLLEWGIHQQDPEVVLMVMYGAGLATHERGYAILEEGLHNPKPQIQLTAFHYLQSTPNQAYARATRQLLASPYLQVRLEALLSLAMLKDPQTINQVEALMSKVPPEAAVLFPQILAMTGNAASIRLLRKLLHHGTEGVRVAAVLAVAKYQRDDLLREVQQLSQHPSPLQQEACAYAMAVLGDDRSLPFLELMLRSRDENVLLTVHKALVELGRTESTEHLREQALRGNLFAIRLLGDIEGNDDFLAGLVRVGDLHVRVNAGIALLEHKDPRCLPAVSELLFLDSRDLIIAPCTSRSGCLKAWRMVASANERFKDQPMVCELSSQLREQTFKKTLLLPEKEFLSLVELTFKKQQNDLIPLSVRLLQELGTEQALHLLQTYRQQLGAPWIRNWCNLALYRMGEEGGFGELLCDWAKGNQQESLIQFRPILPWQLRQKVDQYELTPEEKSRFLVEVFEALAIAQDDQGISTLLEAIENGNQKNRYALAGLLLRAIH